MYTHHLAECSPTCEAGYTCVAPNTCRRGVQLMLGGVNYPNNSVIQFDSIYYTLDHCHSLLCMTDRVPCCSHPQTGSWYNVQPNGSFTGVSQSVNSGYYQSRENDGTIRLQQAEAVQSTNSSLYYCCQLLDATSTTQTLCVTISKLAIVSQESTYYRIAFFIASFNAIYISTYAYAAPKPRVTIAPIIGHYLGH